MTNRLWTKNFIGVCATNFFMVLNYYFLLVTLPVYLIQNLEGPKSQAGLIVTVFFIAAIVSRPFTGQWIESLGIRKVFITAVIIYLGSTLLYFFATSVISLLALRVVHGLGFGMITTATGAIVADIVPEDRKGEGMGYYGLMINISMAIGPFLGLTSLYNWGSGVMFFISTISVILGCMTGALISLPKKVSTTFTETKTITKKPGLNLKGMFEGSAIPISLVILFFALVYSSIISFLSVYAEEIQMADVASYFFVVYAIILILSRPFTGRWFDKYGANVIMYPSILCFATGMFILSQANSSFLFLLSAAFIGVGWGTIFPSTQTIAIQMSPPARRSVATATFLFTLDIGVGIGSFIVGIIGAWIGYSSLYFYSSFFVLIGLIIYYVMYGKGSKERRILAKEHAIDIQK